MRGFFLWCRSVFMRGRLEREMREEMSLHIAQATARNIGRGMKRDDATKAAEREFGNVVYLQEQGRDARGQRWIDALKGDLRFAFRHFRRTPLSTLTMIVVLSLGLGANTALFALVQALRGMPPHGIERDDSLVRIRGIQAYPTARFERLMPYAEVQANARRTQVFSDVAAFAPTDVPLFIGRGGAIAGRASFVTDNFFRLLSVETELGAGLPAVGLNEDPASTLVAVISHYLWQSQFGGATDVIGRTLRVDSTTVTIVGVAPAGFIGTTGSTNKNATWLPLAARAAVYRRGSAALSSPDSALFKVIARLQPAVSPGSASMHVRTVADAVGRQRTPARNQPVAGADVVPLLARNDGVQNDGGQVTEAALAGSLSLLILLITCTNVSALLLGLAVARRREIGVRIALGASRRRIIRQLLTESVCLAVAAGALGMFATWALLRVTSTFIPELRTLLLLDAWVASLTFAFALGTGIFFGLSPALHATRAAVADVLKDTASAVSLSRSWLQRGLIVVQIALTQPLLVALGATMLVIVDQTAHEPERDNRDRIARVSLNWFTGDVPFEQRRADVTRLAERIAALPGVSAAVPHDDGGHYRTLHVHPDDRSDAAVLPDSVMAAIAFAPVGYFDLMDVPVIRGRDFERQDALLNGAAIIGSDVARSLFGDGDPIGRRFGFKRDSTHLTVVGVVDAAVAGRGIGIPNASIRVFVPWTVMASEILVRTEGPAEPLIPALRKVALAEIPYMPVNSISTLEEIESWQRRWMLKATMTAAAGGLLALFLAAIGLYAVISFAVSQRVREIGIRTALGAGRGQVVGVFFRSGMRLAALGLVLGLPLSLIVLRVLVGEFDLPRVNTMALALMIGAVVVAIATLATWIPARRAAAIDPLLALRSE